MCVYVYVCAHVFAYVCAYVCMCLRMCVYVYVCGGGDNRKKMWISTMSMNWITVICSPWSNVRPVCAERDSAGDRLYYKSSTCTFYSATNLTALFVFRRKD